MLCGSECDCKVSGMNKIIQLFFCLLPSFFSVVIWNNAEVFPHSGAIWLVSFQRCRTIACKWTIQSTLCNEFVKLIECRKSFHRIFWNSHISALILLQQMQFNGCREIDLTGFGFSSNRIVRIEQEAVDIRFMFTTSIKSRHDYNLKHNHSVLFATTIIFQNQNQLLHYKKRKILTVFIETVRHVQLRECRLKSEILIDRKIPTQMEWCEFWKAFHQSVQ